MKHSERGTILIPLLIILIVVAGGFVIWHAKQHVSNAPTSRATQQRLQAAKQLPPVGQNFPEATVTISPTGISPQSILLRRGQRVKWINITHADQTLTPSETSEKDDASMLAAIDSIKPGESVSLSFDTSGTIFYINTPGGAKGQIQVQ